MSFEQILRDERLAEELRDYLNNSPLSIPRDIILGPVGRFVREVVDHSGMPEEYVVGSILAVTSGTIGLRYSLRLNRQWVEPAIIWSVLVGPPGAMKTPAMMRVPRPVRDIMSEAWTRYREELSDWRRLPKEARESSPKPRLLTPVIYDSTFEELIEAHQDNPLGLVLIADEALSWLGSLDRYRKGGDLNHYLSLYQGGEIYLRRKTVDHSGVTESALSILTGVQTDRLSSFSRGDARSSGLLERIFWFLPQGYPATYYTDPPETISEEERTWYDFIRKLYSSGSREEVRLSGPARSVWVSFVNETVDLRRACIGELSEIVSLLSKSPAHVARIALVLHVIDRATGVNRQSVISTSEVERAISLVRYLWLTFYRSITTEELATEDANDEVSKASEMYLDGAPIKEIAETLGKVRATIYNWKKKYPKKFPEL